MHAIHSLRGNHILSVCTIRKCRYNSFPANFPFKLFTQRYFLPDITARHFFIFGTLPCLCQFASKLSVDMKKMLFCYYFPWLRRRLWRLKFDAHTVLQTWQHGPFGLHWKLHACAYDDFWLLRYSNSRVLAHDRWPVAERGFLEPGGICPLPPTCPCRWRKPPSNPTPCGTVQCTSWDTLHTLKIITCADYCLMFSGQLVFTEVVSKTVMKSYVTWWTVLKTNTSC